MLTFPPAFVAQLHPFDLVEVEHDHAAAKAVVDDLKVHALLAETDAQLALCRSILRDLEHQILHAVDFVGELQDKRQEGR
jgi:hypothetical protein